MTVAVASPIAGSHPITYGLDASVAKFTVTQYQRMIETGILTPADPVELLENHVVLKMPRNPLHDGTVLRFTKRFGRYLPNRWDIRCQSAIVLSESQPEPDLAIVRESPDDYMTRHPIATDVGLVIEVADSSLLRDQQDKTRIYARAGIPIYWIVNLVDRVLEVYDQPTGPSDAPSYQNSQSFAVGDAVPFILDGTLIATISAVDLLP